MSVECVQCAFSRFEDKNRVAPADTMDKSNAMPDEPTALARMHDPRQSAGWSGLQKED